MNGRAVFTGLVQALGTLQFLQGDIVQITCVSQSSGLLLQDLALGDSVAVDGVCLTVTEILPRGFKAVVSPETCDRSTLKTKNGGLVNLEPSLRIGSKLGGHFVTGHVDGIGHLEGSVQTATSWEMTFTTSDPQVARYLIPKGSIAVNGISLTVADCNPTGTRFTVAVIPLTYSETNLYTLQPGSPVNLEGDILGKYVEKFLRSRLEGHSSSNIPEALSPAFLAEHGYL
jgi:riboflavin synthase